MESLNDHHLPIEQIEQERESFERFLFEKFELDYGDLNLRDSYFRQRKGKYLNDIFNEQFEVWIARAVQNQWVSVKDRLPDYKNETEQFMTICQWEDLPNSYFYRIQRLAKISKHIYFDNEPCNAKTIYWRPLPPPPASIIKENHGLL